MRQGTSGHCQIEFSAARPAKAPVQVGGEGGLVGSEGNGCGSRKERLLGFNLLGQAVYPP